MRAKVQLLLAGFALIAFSAAFAQESDAVKKDMAQLQGEWVMVSGLADGQSVPEGMLSNSKRVCKGDETTVTVGSQFIMKAKFTLDPSKKPKAIDYEMIEGVTKGKKQLGIYEFDGEKVKFCFGAPGAERPTDFTSKTGEKRTSSVWKREKPASPKSK